MRTGEVQLVVTDLDGTVWDGTGRIHPRTLAALHRLADQDVPILAATARRPATVLPKMRAHGIILPSVLFDGSLGRDFTTGTTFHRCLFDQAEARWVLEMFTSFGIEPIVNVDNPSRDAVVGPSPSTHPDHLKEIAAVLRQSDLAEVVEHESVLSFIVCGRPRDCFVELVAALIPRVAVSVSRDLTFGEFVMSARPTGVSKWAGVAAYCSLHHLDPTRILAVGDGENDLELLTSAAIACAVDGSCEELIQRAHHVVGRPEDGGWAMVVELVG